MLFPSDKVNLTEFALDTSKKKNSKKKEKPIKKQLDKNKIL